MPRTMRRYDGLEVEVRHHKPLDGGARLELEHPDGRRWRVDVSHDGTVRDVVTSWRDGQIDEVDLPDWITDRLSAMALPA